MKWFDTINGMMQLFPKKIIRRYTDASSGAIIDETELNFDEVPHAFDKPITVILNQEYWQVVSEPTDVKELRKKKYINLGIKKVNGDEAGILFPSRALDGPSFTTSTAGNDLLYLPVSLWRQIEFLPKDELPKIEANFTEIDNIISSEKNSLSGYYSQHVRSDIDGHQLDVPMEQLEALIHLRKSREVAINNQGCIKDAFAVYTDLNIFYGIVEDGIIRQLCLYNFDCMNEEILNVMDAFSLLLVDWPNVGVFGSEMEDDTAKGSLLQST